MKYHKITRIDNDLCFFLDCWQVRSLACVCERIFEEVSKGGIEVHDQSSIGHVTVTALFIPSSTSVNALGIVIPALVSAYLPGSLVTVAGAMSKPLIPPPDNHKPTRRKNPGQSVNQLKTWQVPAHNVPMYFKKKPPRDPESFIYVQVVMLWPALGKASLVDVLMSQARRTPARFFAFFTGDCTGFFRDVKTMDILCLYLSDATVRQVEEQCKQNTLNLPFTLTWDKICRLKYVEKGMIGRSTTLPTGALPQFSSGDRR